jgi:hypothetical protein
VERREGGWGEVWWRMAKPAQCSPELERRSGDDGKAMPVRHSPELERRSGDDGKAMAAEELGGGGDRARRGERG